MSEGQALCICHTSGTTGAARAVVYSHRSVVLHALGALGVDSHGVSRGSVVLPLTPMFHLMAWGFPYSAALAPASLVLAGADTSPEALATLIERERVTLAAGIPTFWVRLLDALEDPARDLSSLRRVLSGGAAAPARAGRALRRGRRRVRVLLGHDRGRIGHDAAPRGRRPRSRTRAPASGRARRSPGVELRITAPDGGELPWDGVATGELEARGPWVASAYLDDEPQRLP